MNTHRSLLVLFIVLSLTLSACAASPSDDTKMDKSTEIMLDEPTEVMMDETAAPDMMMHDTPTPDAVVSVAEGEMISTPGWFSTTLTNVNTGETFTINDFQGKVVLVETMAMWCPSCKRQQMEVKSLLEKMGMPADLVVVALDIDPNEDGDTLKVYSTDNGFDWIYAIAPADVSREIAELYGDQFLNPPSTPILIIDREGETHPLPFGIKNADELMKAIEM